VSGTGRYYVASSKIVVYATVGQGWIQLREDLRQFRMRVEQVGVDDLGEIVWITPVSSVVTRPRA
jgi:hypothetical protein